MHTFSATCESRIHTTQAYSTVPRNHLHVNCSVHSTCAPTQCNGTWWRSAAVALDLCRHLDGDERHIARRGSSVFATRRVGNTSFFWGERGQGRRRSSLTNAGRIHQPSFQRDTPFFQPAVAVGFSPVGGVSGILWNGGVVRANVATLKRVALWIFTNNRKSSSLSSCRIRPSIHA